MHKWLIIVSKRIEWNKLLLMNMPINAVNMQLVFSSSRMLLGTSAVPWTACEIDSAC
jgi:hypothetical protein